MHLNSEDWKSFRDTRCFCLDSAQTITFPMIRYLKEYSLTVDHAIRHSYDVDD